MENNMSLQNELKTILLVEDEALIAINEASILEKNGYQVKTVYDAEAAINAADEIDIDLILMDIDLGEGEMDGTEAAEAILKRHDVPIVFLSSHTEPEIVEKTEGITSYGYIVKNSGETVLLASIKMAFRLFETKTKEKEKEQFLEGIFNGIDIAVFVVEVIEDRFLFSKLNNNPK
jgi:DNA-binding response OmpR family regulator